MSKVLDWVMPYVFPRASSWPPATRTRPSDRVVWPLQNSSHPSGSLHTVLATWVKLPPCAFHTCASPSCPHSRALPLRSKVRWRPTIGALIGALHRPTSASGPSGAVKLAVTERFAPIARAQAPLPAQSPLQPVKVWPAAGVTVSVTAVPPA